METSTRGFCPFRVQKSHFQPGCVLQRGKDKFCYTRDQRPLIRKQQPNKNYFCPLLNFTLSLETYDEIENVITSVLLVQDEQETAINLWPIFCRSSKITHPTKELVTSKGKEIQQISQKVRDELNEIVLNLT